MIVSVSRRCDIPRFSFGWFMERLDAGYAEAANPFNPRQLRRIPLLPPGPGRKTPECAEVFAFWTREPSAILEHAAELEKRGYGFFVMVTLNAYPALLEKNAPSPREVIQTIKLLAQKITPGRVMWRYDPVFLSNKTDYEFHRRNFASLAAALGGAVKRVIVSVYDEYPGAERRLAALEQTGALNRLPHYGHAGPDGTRPLLPEVRELLTELAGIGRNEDMEMQSCAEEDLSGCGIRAGACVDGGYITETFGLKAPGRDRGQRRPGCLCVQSADIGTYGHCPAGCVYCYGLRS